MSANASDQVDAIERRITAQRAPYALLPASPNGTPYQRFAAGPKHLMDIFAPFAKRGERAFLVTPEASYSYQKILNAATRCRGLLVQQDVQPCDRIAIASASGLDWIAWFFATVAAGAVPVLVPPDRAAPCAVSAGCAFVVCESGDNADYGAAAAIPARAYANSQPVFGSETWLAAAASPDMEALIAFTSGSSHAPKAVCHSHRSVTTGLMNMMLSSALAGASTPKKGGAFLPPCALTLMPLSHVTGYSQMLLAALLGFRLALPGALEGRDLNTYVKRAGVTSVSAVNGLQVQHMLGAPDARENLASIRSWSLGGNYPSRDLLEAIGSVTPGAAISSGYGLTETSGGICAVTGEAYLHSPEAVGRVPLSVAVCILDEEGREVAAGETGSVWLAGDMLMKGYLGEHGYGGIENGWFHTGDLGSFDSARQLRIAGRRAGTSNAMAIVTLHQWLRTQVTGEFQVVNVDTPGGTVPIIVVPAANASLVLRLWELDASPLRAQGALVMPCHTFPRTASGKIDLGALRAIAGNYLRNLRPYNEGQVFT